MNTIDKTAPQQTKKQWVTPDVEIINTDSIAGGAHHNAPEGMGGFPKTGKTATSTTNGHS